MQSSNDFQMKFLLYERVLFRKKILKLDMELLAVGLDDSAPL
jgi:hypothetical protein